jgi:hypothetical protein
MLDYDRLNNAAFEPSELSECGLSCYVAVLVAGS